MKKISAIALVVCLALSTGLMAENEVNAREDNQQARIANGDANGTLTKGETKHIDKEEKGIHKQVKRDRKANGGKLTKAEHKQVNHELNKTSHQIHHDKKVNADKKK